MSCRVLKIMKRNRNVLYHVNSKKLTTIASNSYHLSHLVNTSLKISSFFSKITNDSKINEKYKSFEIVCAYRIAY